MAKKLIKFLTLDGDVYLCPYCMMHQPGAVQLCIKCGHAIDREVDIRTTENYRKKHTIRG